MKRDHPSIEELFRQSRQPDYNQQMAIALERVRNRLRFDRGAEAAGAERQPEASTLSQQSDAATSGWGRPVVATAAAAALFALVVSLWIPWRVQGLYAVLEAADSSVYRVADGDRIPIRVSDRIAPQEMILSNGGSGAVLALADGSRVEIGAKSEMWWDRTDDGLMVRLNTGSIIVSAAKEAAGRLYVQTKDLSAAVARTTSLVNVADDGSRVAVIEGEALVREGTVETRLRPGQQVATSQRFATRSVKEDLAWSRHASAHLAILEALGKE